MGHLEGYVAALPLVCALPEMADYDYVTTIIGTPRSAYSA